jgi:hypothetical protein
MRAAGKGVSQPSPPDPPGGDAGPHLQVSAGAFVRDPVSPQRLHWTDFRARLAKPIAVYSSLKRGHLDETVAGEAAFRS